MDLSIINETKINQINEGLWTINQYEFYVEIRVVNYNSIDKDLYLRKINQNELASIQTQINVSHLNGQTYGIFTDHLNKMERYHKIVEYLNLQGIIKFKSIYRKLFSKLERKFDKFDFKKIYKNCPKMSFFSKYIQYPAFRVIGEIILTKKYPYYDLIPYLRCILGESLERNFFENKLNTFMDKLDNDVLFDASKLGYNFCIYFSDPHNVTLHSIITDKDLIFKDLISKLKNQNAGFIEKLSDSYYRNNLLIFKVIRPSHCYHCIASIARIITERLRIPFYLNEKTMIFCQNDGNFVEKINEIAKTSIKDSEINSYKNLTYFIIHPELLNEEDHSFLVEFLNARMNAISSQQLPKVIIISSLDYTTFCSNHLKKFNDIEFRIDKELIKILCKMSYPIDLILDEKLGLKEEISYQLYYSDNAGSGKTYQIIKDFKEKNNCCDVNGDDILQSLFIDVNTKGLPGIKYIDHNEIKEYKYVHLDLSPELFDNNYRFFDDLWTICVFRYQFDSDGTSINTPPNIFFEVPTLTKKQYPEGGFIDESDFPIYVDVYHKISSKKDDIDTNIKIPSNVKTFCDAIFKTNIEYTSELLSIMCHMFYHKISFNESAFVPRILEEINIFMEEFCNSLSLDDENSKAIFLLLLRTNFHVWNMESLFTKTEQPKSFIITSNQNLFSNEKDKEKWIILCFSSQDEKLVWDTSFLKFNINKVEESKLFQNKFFSKLNDNPNIKIYSNQLNYVDDQAYFFNIIKSFFYSNKNKETKYRKITDGVICNSFINTDLFKEHISILSIIKSGKDFYESSKQLTNKFQWGEVLQSINSILTDYMNIPPLEIVNNLTDNKTVIQICNITLAMTIVKRFIIMIIRIVLKQPLIFEGFTGVGKTSSVKLLKILIKIARDNDDFKWSFHQVNCHGALQLKELLDIQEEELNYNFDVNNHIFFFDELNTSPVSNYVINEMNNYYLKSKYNIGKNEKSRFDKSSIVFIAAINPYIKVDKFSRNFSRVGIKQNIPSKISKLRLCCTTPKNNKNMYEITDLNKLAYNVHELSHSTKMIVIKSDPELFYFNKDDLNIKSSIFLPPDEIKTISHIVNHYLNILTNDITIEDCILFEDDDKITNNLDIIENTLKSNRKSIEKILLSSLCLSFLEVRELMKLKSILSFRDVKRLMQFFILFFQKLVKVYFKQQKDITNEILVNKIIPQSIVLSLMISIVFRFSNETKIETENGDISSSADEEEKIILRCAKFGLHLVFSNDRSYYKVGIRSVLLEKLQKMEWSENIKNPENWNKIVLSYSWMKCMKYIYKDKNDSEYNSSLFKLNTLMIHLFAISSCYSACKHNRDSVIPCLIIGMPGTSKTLAIQLFTDYKQKNSKTKKNFFSTTYLSTRVSEAEGLNAHYRDCAMFMMDDIKNFAVCVIDELGLANLNETRPLKLLHYYFDKGITMKSDNKSTTVPVMSIAASNYALDFANMNRGILICTDIPTDREIAEAFYFSELESNKERKINKDVIIGYKIRYFDDDYDFFDWKKDEKINKFENFLKILWSLTEKKERPDMITLRPLYLLFNTIFHNRDGNMSNRELVDNLCLYLISAISCNPSDSFDKLKSLVEKLKENNDEFEDLHKIVINQKQSAFNAFVEIFNGKKNNKYYKKFIEIIENKTHKKKCPDDFITIKNKIDDKKQNAFKYFYKILKDQNDNDTYKSFKNIAKKGEIFKKLTKEINDPKYDNYKILRRLILSIISNKEGKSKRALCFRTKNYECLDFIEDLLYDTTKHYLRGEGRKIIFKHAYPADFKLSKQVSADDAIQNIIDIITKSKEEKNTLYYFLIIGNICFVDSLLDLLNAPNEGKSEIETKKPLISRNGFSVELNEYPKNIVFCFIMNENDFQIRNSADSFPVPLLDRLNQLYFDYDQRDEFGIIEKYQKFNQMKSKYSTPFSLIIHDYFNRFVKNLRFVPIPKEENNYAAVFCTTRILNDSYNHSDQNKLFLCDVDHDEINLQGDNIIDWNKHIFVLKFYSNNSNESLMKCEENVDLLKNKKERKIIFYWSHEIEELYDVHIKDSVFNIPLPLPDNYENLENDGSINKLINKLQLENEKGKRKNKKDIEEEEEEEEEEAFDEPIRGIILTTSPMMEELKLIEKDSKNLITKENTLFLFDQYITSSEDFNKRIKNAKKKNITELTNIVIQLNTFQIEHDRFIRFLLEDQKKMNTFIIYHLKNSIIPKGLYTSKQWPVYWIESISNSSLAEFKTTDIVNCIRFKQFYKLKMDELYYHIFHQIYYEICERHQNKINEKKVEQILKSIINILKTKCPKKSDVSYLNSVDFADLIDKIEGKTIKSSYRKLDFKREFLNLIVRHIPFLDGLIQILVLNCNVINERKIDDTLSFIDKILIDIDIERLIQIADINNRNYRQLNNNGIYFPELIFPQVFAFYDAFIKNKDTHPVFDKDILKIFFYLQAEKGVNCIYIDKYCDNYFMSYLTENEIYDEDKLQEFHIKLMDSIKQIIP